MKKKLKTEGKLLPGNLRWFFVKSFCCSSVKFWFYGTRFTWFCEEKYVWFSKKKRLWNEKNKLKQNGTWIWGRIMIHCKESQARCRGIWIVQKLRSPWRRRCDFKRKDGRQYKANGLKVRKFEVWINEWAATVSHQRLERLTWAEFELQLLFGPVGPFKMCYWKHGFSVCRLVWLGKGIMNISERLKELQIEEKLSQ